MKKNILGYFTCFILSKVIYFLGMWIDFWNEKISKIDYVIEICDSISQIFESPKSNFKKSESNGKL